jgi:hypothetical protein
MNFAEILILMFTGLTLVLQVTNMLLSIRILRARRNPRPVEAKIDGRSLMERFPKKYKPRNEKAIQMFGRQYFELKDYQKKEVGLAVSKSQDYLALSSDIPGHQNQSGPSLA